MNASRDEDTIGDSRVADLAAEFDSQDMGDRWATLPEAKFDVDISRRTYLVAVEEDVMARIRELAKAEHKSPGDLVNSWLRDRLARA